jgi:uncharacterized protein
MVSDPSTWKLPRLRIDRDGLWYHDDGEVTHEGILATLREGLRRDADGHYLQVGPVRVPVEVDDAPFVVLRAEDEGDGLAVILNDGSRELLRPETLRLAPGEVPYATVKDGRFHARFNRAAAYQLLQRLAEDPASGGAALVLGARRWTIPRVERA